jgi:hypothetical protein
MKRHDWDRIERRWIPVPIKSERDPGFLFDAFSSREPTSISLEDAIEAAFSYHRSAAPAQAVPERMHGFLVRAAFWALPRPQMLLLLHLQLADAALPSMAHSPPLPPDAALPRIVHSPSAAAPPALRPPTVQGS